MENRKINLWGKGRKRLELCKKLIMSGQYVSQEDIRLAMKKAGYKRISQSSVSRMLAMLGVAKIQNARGQQIYTLFHRIDDKSIASELRKPLVAAIVRIEHNNKFVIIHTVNDYGGAIANIIELYSLPEILGIISVGNIVWVAPRHIKETSFVCQKIVDLLKDRELFNVKESEINL